MAEIKVSTAEVRNKAQELRQLNQQLKTQVEALVNQEASLAGMWEGDAQQAFRNAFSTDKVQFDNFSSVIEQYAVALENIATEYDNKEAMNQSIASTRS